MLILRLGDKLGERYEITRTDIKKWAVGSPIQAVLDAMVILLERHHYDADHVKSVAVYLAPPEALTVNIVKCLTSVCNIWPRSC